MKIYILKINFLNFKFQDFGHQQYPHPQGIATPPTMTRPAAPPLLSVAWERETVIMTPSVLETWCVGRTTVLLGNPSWTAVQVSNLMFYVASALRISGVVTSPKNCSASNNDQSCCTSSSPCGLREGDCDHDDECAGDLVCGDNNCAAGDSDMDCCTSKCNIKALPKTSFPSHVHVKV